MLISWMLRLAGTLAALAAASVAAAADETPPPAWQGVWQGSVGNLPVRACFAHEDWGSFGAYYYMSRLQLIPLQPSDTNKEEFVEGESNDAKAPRWRIEAVKGGVLGGRWTQGVRTLPVRLTRMGAPGHVEDQPCSSHVFQAPRLVGVHVVARPAVKDGVAYTRLILDHGGHFPSVAVETLRLEGSGDAIRRVNARLAEPLTAETPEWLDCVQSALDQGPNEGEMDEKIVPKIITRRWLAVMDESESYCGGAHPNSGSAPRLFDLVSGREEDLHDWLNERAIKRERFGSGTEEAKKLAPAFRTFLLGRWKGNADCDDVVRTEDFWQIELTRTGMVFTPELAHAVQACGESFALPFARLQPYLSAEGKAKAEALRAQH
jgi:hypothetical protein